MWWKSKTKKAREVSQEEYNKIVEDLRQPAYGNWRGNKYVERLIKEWLTHSKIVLAVDFDDTVSAWGFKGFNANLDFKEAIDIIRLAQSIGCYVSIWSACAPDRYEYIRSYCNSNDIKVDSINENPITLPYGNHKKMYYNHLLDDRAGLKEALSMLQYACYRVAADRKPKSDNFDV